MNRSKKIYALMALLLFLFSACEDKSTGGITVVNGSEPEVTEPTAAQAVAFELIDRDMDEDEIYATLVITRASDETDVSEYQLYWGSSATTKLTGQAMIASFTADGTSHTHSFSENTPVPTGATHLLVYSVADTYEATTPTAYDIPDGVIEMVKDINTSSDGNPSHFAAMNGVLYFFANDGSTNWELWKSDGTASGTVILSNSATEIDTNIKVKAVGNTLFFTAADTSSNNYELWKSDGTTAGTNMISDINSNTFTSSNPDLFTALNGELFFKATDSSPDTRLFKSDGTTVTPISSKYPNSIMKSVGSSLFFNSDTTSDGIELWKSDGSVGNAVYVHNINSSGDGFLSNFAEFNGDLYFSAADNLSAYTELWKSNGTGDQTGGTGTILVKEINASGGSNPKNFKVFNSELYFSAQSDSSNRELWKTDGTSSGTALVKTIASSVSVTYDPDRLTVAGNKLFFAAQDSSMNTELWVSDGTTASNVKEIHPTGGSWPDLLTTVGNYLFFTANDNTNGTELWFSDGTAEGTFMLIDLDLGGDGFLNSEMLLVGTNLFMRATNGSDGKELWRYYTK